MLLVDAEANPNSVDNMGNTALMLAVIRGNSEAVTTLITWNADANVHNLFSATPLMVAAKRRNLKIADLLLDAGAKVLVANSCGKTAIDIARANNDATMITLLENAQITP